MPLALRRILAVFVALVLPALAIAAIVGGTQTTDHYKDLVNTAPRHIATLVEVIHPFKGPSEYVVESDGNRFTLGHGEAVDGLDTEPGDPIEYVIDTVDPLWTVGVGDPEYWEPPSGYGRDLRRLPCRGFVDICVRRSGLAAPCGF